MSARVLLFFGALNAALTVIAGAYGAHAVKDPARAALFQTAVQYHLFHALGLLVIGVVAALRPGSALLATAGGLMLLGILLFSGSLYLHAFTGYHGLSIVTPFGGTAFILAWLLLAVAVLRLT
jgi:uncharacterized membrane protein YgdD (TMEM256/DUF423 family)